MSSEEAVSMTEYLGTWHWVDGFVVMGMIWVVCMTAILIFRLVARKFFGKTNDKWGIEW